MSHTTGVVGGSGRAMDGGRVSTTSGSRAGPGSKGGDGESFEVDYLKSLPPCHPHLVEAIVTQIKSQGLFDEFRKACLADIDTKPAYLNLKQRMEGYVSAFLKRQQWSSVLQKNQLREALRKDINESGLLKSGLDHLVDQLVFSRVERFIRPKVQTEIADFLGIREVSPSMSGATTHNVTSLVTSVPPPNFAVPPPNYVCPPPSLPPLPPVPHPEMSTSLGLTAHCGSNGGVGNHRPDGCPQDDPSRVESFPVPPQPPSPHGSDYSVDMSDGSMVGRDEVIADMGVFGSGGDARSSCLADTSSGVRGAGSPYSSAAGPVGEYETVDVQDSMVVLIEGEEISNSPLSNTLLEEDDDDDNGNDGYNDSEQQHVVKETPSVQAYEPESSSMPASLTTAKQLHERLSEDSGSLKAQSLPRSLVQGLSIDRPVAPAETKTKQEQDPLAPFEELSDGGESVLTAAEDEDEAGTPVEDEQDDGFTDSARVSVSLKRAVNSDEVQLATRHNEDNCAETRTDFRGLFPVGNTIPATEPPPPGLENETRMTSSLSPPCADANNSADASQMVIDEGTTVASSSMVLQNTIVEQDDMELVSDDELNDLDGEACAESDSRMPAVNELLQPTEAVQQQPKQENESEQRQPQEERQPQFQQPEQQESQLRQQQEQQPEGQKLVPQQKEAQKGQTEQQQQQQRRPLSPEPDSTQSQQQLQKQQAPQEEIEDRTDGGHTNGDGGAQIDGAPGSAEEDAATATVQFLVARTCHQVDDRERQSTNSRPSSPEARGCVVSPDRVPCLRSERSLEAVEEPPYSSFGGSNQDSAHSQSPASMADVVQNPTKNVSSSLLSSSMASQEQEKERVESLQPGPSSPTLSEGPTQPPCNSSSGHLPDIEEEEEKAALSKTTTAAELTVIENAASIKTLAAVSSERADQSPTSTETADLGSKRTPPSSTEVQSTGSAMDTSPLQKGSEADQVARDAEATSERIENRKDDTSLVQDATEQQIKTGHSRNGHGVQKKEAVASSSSSHKSSSSRSGDRGKEGDQKYSQSTSRSSRPSGGNTTDSRDSRHRSDREGRKDRPSGSSNSTSHREKSRRHSCDDKERDRSRTSSARDHDRRKDSDSNKQSRRDRDREHDREHDRQHHDSHRKQRHSTSSASSSKHRRDKHSRSSGESRKRHHSTSNDKYSGYSNTSKEKTVDKKSGRSDKEKQKVSSVEEVEATGKNGQTSPRATDASLANNSDTTENKSTCTERTSTNNVKGKTEGDYRADAGDSTGRTDISTPSKAERSIKAKRIRKEPEGKHVNSKAKRAHSESTKIVANEDTPVSPSDAVVEERENSTHQTETESKTVPAKATDMVVKQQKDIDNAVNSSGKGSTDRVSANATADIKRHESEPTCQQEEESKAGFSDDKEDSASQSVNLERQGNRLEDDANDPDGDDSRDLEIDLEAPAPSRKRRRKGSLEGTGSTAAKSKRGRKSNSIAQESQKTRSVQDSTGPAAKVEPDLAVPAASAGGGPAKRGRRKSSVTSTQSASQGASQKEQQPVDGTSADLVPYPPVSSRGRQRKINPKYIDDGDVAAMFYRKKR